MTYLRSPSKPATVCREGLNSMFSLAIFASFAVELRFLG